MTPLNPPHALGGSKQKPTPSPRVRGELGRSSSIFARDPMNFRSQPLDENASPLTRRLLTRRLLFSRQVSCPLSCQKMPWKVRATMSCSSAARQYTPGASQLCKCIPQALGAVGAGVVGAPAPVPAPEQESTGENRFKFSGASLHQNIFAKTGCTRIHPTSWDLC
jgi:hypothetical protein